MYAATKAAVLSLATSLSVELRKEKVRVHAICPDGVDTKMVADMKDGGEAQELTAAGGLLQPAQVAHELVEMFGTRRVYKTIPAGRAALARLSGLAPGPVMRAEPLIRRAGRKQIKKQLKAR
jgi:short-subunit dehydrogenase